jgi:hypothetical protein
MNIICKLFGHRIVKELQVTDEFPINDPEWQFTKSVTIYTCTRCFYSHSNKVNFGQKIRVDQIDQ